MIDEGGSFEREINQPNLYLRWLVKNNLKEWKRSQNPSDTGIFK